jgi:hypothetical protein
MSVRSVEELRDELHRLMIEQTDSMKKETFGGLTPQELSQQEQRLKRIREVSADYIAALRRKLTSSR